MGGDLPKDSEQVGSSVRIETPGTAPALAHLSPAPAQRKQAALSQLPVPSLGLVLARGSLLHLQGPLSDQAASLWSSSLLPLSTSK